MYHWFKTHTYVICHRVKGISINGQNILPFNALFSSFIYDFKYDWERAQKMTNLNKKDLKYKKKSINIFSVWPNHCHKTVSELRGNNLLKIFVLQINVCFYENIVICKVLLGKLWSHLIDWVGTSIQNELRIKEKL